MWLFTTDGFLSIVSKGCRPDQLMVRARVKADLKRAFPRAKIITSKPPADYRFRVIITRRALAAYLGKMVERLVYNNFKNTVRDAARHEAYLRVWNALYTLQERPSKPATIAPAPRSGRPYGRGGKRESPFDDLLDELGY